jgi:hypothetical protein
MQVNIADAPTQTDSPPLIWEIPIDCPLGADKQSFDTAMMTDRIGSVRPLMRRLRLHKSGRLAYTRPACEHRKMFSDVFLTLATLGQVRWVADACA